MFNFLKAQQAKVIDSFLTIDVLLSLFCNVYGLRKIDWAITYEIYHVFFILSCFFLVITFMSVIIIIYFRKENTIHTIWNISIKYVIYFIASLNMVGIILVFSTYIHISIHLASPSEPIENNRKFVKFVSRQWSRIFYSMSLTIIFDTIQFPLWYNILKRLKLKTDGNLEGGGFVMVENK